MAKRHCVEWPTVANPVLKDTSHSRRKGRMAKGGGPEAGGLWFEPLRVGEEGLNVQWGTCPILSPSASFEMLGPRRQPSLLLSLLVLVMAAIGAGAKECYQLVNATSSGFQEVDQKGGSLCSYKKSCRKRQTIVLHRINAETNAGQGIVRVVTFFRGAVCLIPFQ